MADMADILLNSMGVGGSDFDEKTKPLNARQQKVIEMLNSGMSQQEIASSFNVNKSMISRDVAFIQENYPEKIIERAKSQKQPGSSYDMPQAPQKPQTVPEPTKTEKSTPKEEKTEEEANIKQKKQVFSFRATIKDIASWKAYATATGQTMENVGVTAMNEYLENHKLTGTEQTIFEAIKAKIER